MSSTESPSLTPSDQLTSIPGAKESDVLSQIREECIEKVDVSEICKERPYLDGTWFQPDLKTCTSTGIIRAKCQSCKANKNGKKKNINGNVNSSSNYRTHIKVLFLIRYAVFSVFIYCNS